MTGLANTWADWPELLQRVADACGGGVALSLAASYGGREIYIPQADAIDEAHPLALTLGLATARTVAEVLSAGKITVPMGPTSTPKRRAALIRKLRREGQTYSAIAQRAGVHERTVYRRLQDDAESGANTTPDLFDNP